MGFEIRPQTGSATGGKLKPYLISLSDGVVPIASSNFILTVTGDNFDTDTEFEVLNDTANNIQITNVFVRTPQEAELTLTVGRTQAFYQIACNNSDNDHFHKALDFETKNLTIIVPALNGVIWENIVGALNTSQGSAETNSTATGWNKQATFGTIPANTDGKLSFTFAGQGSNGSSTSLGMFGLGIDPTANTSYNTIDHALYLNGTNTYIYENGSSRGLVSSLAIGDEFEIRRDSNVIRYYKNGSVIYTSTVASTGVLHFDSCFYRNIKLTDLKIVY